MKELDKVVDIIEEISDLSISNFRYNMKCLKFAKKELLRRLPFKEGDRVELKKTPVITSQMDHGWLGSKHFLKKGAKATVIEVHIGQDSIGYFLEFDNETWIDVNGKNRQVDSKKCYHFSEKFIRKEKR